MDFLEFSRKRYSVRSYSDRPVEQEKRDKILETALSICQITQTALPALCGLSWHKRCTLSAMARCVPLIIGYSGRTLRDGSHTAYLVFDGINFLGAGGVSYYRVMPMYHNPSGNKAYIMNMYTSPKHRRKGNLLVRDAKMI